MHKVRQSETITRGCTRGLVASDQGGCAVVLCSALRYDYATMYTPEGLSLERSEVVELLVVEEQQSISLSL